MKDWRETRILAIDPATTKVGWCVGCGLVYIDSGTINLEKLTGKGKKWVWDRIGQLWFELDVLFLAWEPDRVACEMPRPDHRNRHTNRLMGATVGVMAAVAMREGHSVGSDRPVMWINPKDVRHSDFHKLVRKRTAKIFNVPYKEMTGDRADAIGVWTVAWGLLKEEWMLTPENALKWRKLVES